jgi:hypothetical protein
MFDLGRTFVAAVERSPDALAIVAGERRLSYAAWYGEIGRIAEGLFALGLGRGDRLAVILQNLLEMARSETCLYSLPEQRLGQIPGSGGAARLQKLVGITRAKDIVMRSRRIPGRQACEWGIAIECVADGELEAATDAPPKSCAVFRRWRSAVLRN